MQNARKHSDTRGLHAIRDRLKAQQADTTLDEPMGPPHGTEVTRAEYVDLASRVSRMEAALKHLLRTEREV